MKIPDGLDEPSYISGFTDGVTLTTAADRIAKTVDPGIGLSEIDIRVLALVLGKYRVAARVRFSIEGRSAAEAELVEAQGLFASVVNELESILREVPGGPPDDASGLQ